MEPPIIRAPRFHLAQHVVLAHDGLVAQEAQKAELSHAAEEQLDACPERLEPLLRGFMMDMPVVGKRDPNIDIKEKK